MKSLATLLVLLMIWSVGLLAFAARVDRYAPAPEPPRADAIVALTGASDVRLGAAMRLLEARKGRRMLISGVNRGATRADIREVVRGYGVLFDCCVDLGFQAETTLGNAQETADWARSHRFDSLVVVTSDYHMPRSLVELRAALPGAELHPYPVETDIDAQRWWSSGQSARRITLEYCKYLVVLFREIVLSLGGEEPQRAT
ncbi:MAG TPA: YdcF family protein [Caulobacteraceae bacterium]